MNPVRPPKEWHSRGYLPRFDPPELVQGLTFRLADSLPAEKLAQGRTELGLLAEARAACLRLERMRSGQDARAPARASLTVKAIFPIGRELFDLVGAGIGDLKAMRSPLQTSFTHGTRPWGSGSEPPIHGPRTQRRPRPSTWRLSAGKFETRAPHRELYPPARHDPPRITRKTPVVGPRGSIA